MYKFLKIADKIAYKLGLALTKANNDKLDIAQKKCKQKKLNKK